MSSRDPDQMPTQRQGTVLQTLSNHQKMTAKQIPVRSDVMWRMEERGWVARNYFEAWHILPAGEQALERWEKALGIGIWAEQ